MKNSFDGKDAAHRDPVGPTSDEDYYPPLSDNRYKGLIFWWTFGELRSDPDQLARYVSSW